MKLGLFSDVHFSSAELTCEKRRNNKGLDRIRTAISYFEQTKCDMIICLGDLTDVEATRSQEVENLKKISEVFSNCQIPICTLMGNHDAFTFTVDSFYAIIGEKYQPQNIFKENYNLIFLDACYFQNGNHYQPGDTEWMDTFLPQTKALEDALRKATGNTYIFIHQNIDPTIHESHRIYNDEAVRSILETSGKVKIAFQGHYHAGNNYTLNNIAYRTLPALCENENAYYLVEI